MAGEATEPTLGTLQKRLQGAKDQRRIAKDHLPEAKAALVKVRRASREIVATAKNAIWHARETLRAIRKDQKHLAGRRRMLHRQRRRNEATRTKLDARIEKKQHAAAKMEARIKEDKEPLERLPREDRGQSMLHLLLKVKVAYLKRRSARTRWTAERLGKGTGQLDESRKRIEDGQKDVENRLKDKEREEDAAIEDVEKKRKELDTLTEARKKEEEQAQNHIRKAWENVREKRRAVWVAASRVNRKASQFLRKRVADKAVKIVAFGKWAGFAGVSGCFYAYAVLLGAAYESSYFHSNGVNILSYTEPVDFLTSGYTLATFFILATVLILLTSRVLSRLALSYLKMVVTYKLPLYTEGWAAVLSVFAKRFPKPSVFVLCCTLGLLFLPLVAAGIGYIRPTSQDCVSIMTDPPIVTDPSFEDQQRYVRIGSTGKYLFLKKYPLPQEPEAGGGQSYFETIMASLSAFSAEDSDGAESPKSETAGSKSDAGILVVPLSKITCISEIGGDGAALCESTATVVNGATGEHIHPGYVTEDRIQRIDERTSRFEGRIMAVEQQMSGWSDTVGKGIEDILQVVDKITDPGPTKISFEEDVVKTLESIADKLGQSNDGSPKDKDSGTQSPETCGGAPCTTETLVHQYIADDMDCPPGKLHKSRFFSFAHRRGDVIDKSPEQEPDSREEWEEKMRISVGDWNDKARKWIVYGLASRDGGSDHNNMLSRQRAETVKEMMCTSASETSSETKLCRQNVEVRSLGEDHRVTGPESRSAVIAVCERVSEQSPEKTATPAGKSVPSGE